MDGYARQLEVADKKSEIRVVMSSGPANCDMLDYLTESGITMYELAKSYLTGSNVIKEIVEAAVEKVLKRVRITNERTKLIFHFNIICILVCRLSYGYIQFVFCFQFS